MEGNSDHSVNIESTEHNTFKKHELSHFGIASIPPKITRMRSFSRKNDEYNNNNNNQIGRAHV